MVVVGEHHPVRRHVYNLCVHCDGTYIDTCGVRAAAPLEDDSWVCVYLCPLV